MPDLAPGVEFAGHRIEGVAGRGGMGVVYRATQLALDHEVALKVISPELAGDDVFRRRFISECRAAVSIRHPNVVPIHHAGEEDGLLFVTMALVGGSDLRKVLNAEGRLGADRAAGITAQLAAALDAAHAAGLIHRDVKPGNVLIEERQGAAGGDHVYLTDFGLTKRLGGAHSDMTATGAFVGTIDYVAPEQIQGGELDARTDVYALGCVLYEMLAGRTPFGDRDDKVAKIYGHIQDPPQPLRELAPEAPEALGGVIVRALAKEPGDRYPSAGDLARAAISASEGSEVMTPERAVATGEAAIADQPTRAFESPPATPEAEEEPASSGTAATEAAATTPADPARRRPGEDGGGRGPGPGLAARLAAAGALAAIVAIAVIVLSGGGDDPPAGDGGGEGGGAPRVRPLIGVDGFPVGVTVAGDGAVWVASREGEKVTRIEGGEAEPIPLPGSRPEGMVEADGRIWVANGAGGVVPVPVGGGEPGAAIPIGATPKAIAAAPDGTIWASDGGGSVSRIDPGGGSEAFAAGPRTHGVAVAAGSVWVTNRGSSGSVTRLSLDDPGGPTDLIPVGANPKGIEPVPGTGELWVANTDDGTIQAILTGGPAAGATVAVGRTPRDLAFGAGFLWVSNGDDGTVTRVDPETRETLVVEDVCEGPEDIAFGARSVWVACGASGGGGPTGVVEIRP